MVPFGVVHNKTLQLTIQMYSLTGTTLETVCEGRQALDKL